MGGDGPDDIRHTGEKYAMSSSTGPVAVYGPHPLLKSRDLLTGWCCSSASQKSEALPASPDDRACMAPGTGRARTPRGLIRILPVLP